MQESEKHELGGVIVQESYIQISNVSTDFYMHEKTKTFYLENSIPSRHQTVLQKYCNTIAPIESFNYRKPPHSARAGTTQENYLQNRCQ